MASSFDHEDVRFLLVASTQLHVSRALILTVDKSVAKPAQHSAYEMRAEAGLDPDNARRKLLDLALKGQALDLLAQHDLPPESNATVGKVSLPISMTINFCLWLRGADFRTAALPAAN